MESYIVCNKVNKSKYIDINAEYYALIDEEERKVFIDNIYEAKTENNHLIDILLSYSYEIEQKYLFGLIKVKKIIKVKIDFYGQMGFVCFYAPCGFIRLNEIYIK